MYEDIDGCCTKEGDNGEIESWCFCKTNVCNYVPTLPSESLPRCAALQLSNGVLISAIKLSTPTSKITQLSATPEIFSLVVSVIFVVVFRFM